LPARRAAWARLGLLLLLATALALVLTIDRTLNAIWRVRQPRPLGQRVLVYWAALTLGPLALGVSLTLTSYAVIGLTRAGRRLPGGVRLVLDLMQFVLLAAARPGCSTTCPTPMCAGATPGPAACSWRWRSSWPRSRLAWYVDSVPSYSTVYGALATLPILLLWIYLGWVIVLLGAVIAAYAPSLQMRVVSRPPHAGLAL
jgi:membrane protein